MIGDYRKLSIQQKQAEALARAREQPVRCPHCNVATAVDELLAHVRERCPGRVEPHPHALWLGWQSALELGMARAALSRAVASGLVRARGRGRTREVLLRDVVLEVARREVRPGQSRGATTRLERGLSPAPVFVDQLRLHRRFAEAKR